jgi:hypothetical protein
MDVDGSSVGARNIGDVKSNQEALRGMISVIQVCAESFLRAFLFAH